MRLAIGGESEELESQRNALAGQVFYKPKTSVMLSLRSTLLRKNNLFSDDKVPRKLSMADV
jgi:hypothetical protein